MSYHHNPIEPPDWSDGPNDMEGDCPTCEGTGEITKDDDAEQTCPSCGGSGFTDNEPDETEWGE